MARLGCKCGADMTNTISPSKNIINIFYLKEAMNAINSNPRIRLWDFYTGWDDKITAIIVFRKEMNLLNTGTALTVNEYMRFRLNLVGELKEPITKKKIVG